INNINNQSAGNNQGMNYRHDLYLEKSLNSKVILSLRNDLYFNIRDNQDLGNQVSIIYAESDLPKSRLAQTDNETADINNKVNANLQLKLHKKFNINVFADYNLLNYKRDEEFALAIDEGELIERNESENDLH